MKDLLIVTSHEKLVDILLSLHGSNDDIQERLDIIFAALDDSPENMISIIKKEIGHL